MKGWALWLLAAVVLTPAGRAQTATEILQKVAAAYRGGAPLDIEWVEGFEHQSQALTSATQSHIRMVQSGTKARLEQGGMLYVSDGVHDWQYSSAFNEYAQTKERHEQPVCASTCGSPIKRKRCACFARIASICKEPACRAT